MVVLAHQLMHIGPKTASEGAQLNNSAKMPRIAAATALVACMVMAFAALGGVGQAGNAISAAQSQYGKKVTICHKGKTIKVSKHAVRAHLRHHDTLRPVLDGEGEEAQEAPQASRAPQAPQALRQAEATSTPPR